MSGHFVTCERFWDEFPVQMLNAEYGTGPIGLWLLIGGYHASYSDYDYVPRGVLRVVVGKDKDARHLEDRGFLLEADKGWRLGFRGYLWDIVHSRSGTRLPISGDVRSAVFDRDGEFCQFCGTANDLTLDHIIPWSHGGPDTVVNLRVLCRPCNSSRGNRVEALA